MKLVSRQNYSPLLIFIGVGAMIDFRPLLAMPKMVILGAAGQFGIYGTLILGCILAKYIPGLKWGLAEAASLVRLGQLTDQRQFMSPRKLRRIF
jgi:oxaloacetate decarboxylase beta subunit